MPIPEGYEKLAVIGIVNKGEYSRETEYKQYNYVYYEGSTYLALKDNPAVPPTNNKVDWQYLAQGVVGAKGDKGEPGAKGEQGVSITDAKIEEGVLHIMLSDGQDITVGSVAITKDAVVDALGYTPAGGENLWSINNNTFRNVTYTGKQYEASDGDYRSPIIFVLQQWEGYNTNVLSNLDIKGNGIGLYKGTGTIASGCTILRFKNNGASDEFWVDHPNPLKAGDTFTFSFELVDDTVGHCKFKNIKLEPGTVTDPVWTPAPEDVVVRSELDAELDYSISRFGKNTLNNVDLNNITKSGLYELAGNITSNPGWNYGGLAVFGGRQFSWDTTGITVSTRYKYNNVWSTWTKLTP